MDLLSLLWYAAFSVPAILIAGLWLLRRYVRKAAAQTEISRMLQGKETVGFFHPFAHAGGGGERVLWCAVRAVQVHHAGVQIVVYTGDVDVPKNKFLELAKDRFGVELDPSSVHFVHLHGRRWVDAARWPRFTLLGQSIGSIVLGWEALCAFHPDIFVDSMGYAFTLPLFSVIGNCRIGCYVHYPTISTDMLRRVKNRTVGVCNDAVVAKSSVLSAGKLLYYRLFAWIYGCAGRFAEVIMVNSSWTSGHILQLWKSPKITEIVYPPCDTAALAELPLERAPIEDGGIFILSLAQFRPEKNQALQVRSLALLYELSPERRNSGAGRVRLVVAGGCRDAGDRQRVEALQALCKELGLKEKGERNEDWDVSFRTNVSGTEMRQLLSQATIGLHTMSEEHFGINVVEFMAAGAIPLAHRSGGPKMDIVIPVDGEQTGFLADDEASYAKAMQDICSLPTEKRVQMAKAARKAVRTRFAQEAFEQAIADRLMATLRKAA